MADIEDRVLQHSHAFEGLLSLVPGAERRVPTKQERKEEDKRARRAKLEQKLAARGEQIENGEPKKDVVQQKKPKPKPDPKPKQITENKPSEASETKTTETPTNLKSKKKQQQKEKATPKDDLSNGTAENAESEKKELPKRGPGKKIPAKMNSAKKGKAKEESEEKKSITKEPAAKDFTDEDASAEISKDFSLELSEVTAPTEPAGGPTTQTENADAPPQPTEPISPTARAEARARLTAHIESLRIHRNPKSTARAALLEAREKKEAARKERKKTLRLAQKLESTTLGSPGPSASSSVRPPPMTPKEMEKAENNFTFGAVTFDDGQELDHTLSDFKKSCKRKGPTDVMGQLKQVEAKRARLETMDPEKRERIYEKEMWSKALKQTAGEKVRDDEKLLKKALKRQVVQKKKSEREWKERKDSVAKGIAARQKKREENINARKEQKKLGKAGMKKKARMVQKAGGKKKPPPQHSKNKGRKKSGDKSKSAGKSGGTSGGKKI